MNISLSIPLAFDIANGNANGNKIPKDILFYDKFMLSFPLAIKISIKCFPKHQQNISLAFLIF